MAGRRPKPTALKLIQGNPGRRKLNASEPKPTAGAEPPPGMTDGAVRAWKLVAPQLQRLGLLTEIDSHALMLFCEAHATFTTAREKLAATGEVVRSPKGYPIWNPYLAIRNRSMEQMRQFMIEFGMTPAARSRISTGAGSEDEGDPWLALTAT